MQLIAKTTINATLKKTIEWFYSLVRKPEQYAFAEHEGFYPLEGNINEIGSTFYTREKIGPFFITINFTTIAVTDTSFSFLVTKPYGSLHITGSFACTALSEKETLLTLSITPKYKKFSSWILFASPLKNLLLKQITREVLFIKKKLKTLINKMTLQLLIKIAYHYPNKVTCIRPYEITSSS